MKVRDIFLFVLLTMLLNKPVISQVIKLAVTSKGNPTISLNGKIVKNGDEKEFATSTNSGIRFDFSDIKDVSAKFTIKKGLQNGGADGIIELDNNYFKVATTLSTDDKMRITVNNQIIDAEKPFIVSLLSLKTNALVQCTFIPRFNSQGTETTNSLPGTVNKNNEESEEEKKYHPGSPIYDGLKLADNNNLSGEELKAIVKYYYPVDTVDDVEKAKKLIADNPFLKGIDISVEPLKADRASAQAGGDILSSLSSSAVGGLDITTFADGLAKFLVKRTKQELTMAFFEKFKKIIDGTPDLKTVFPNIADHLDNIGEEIYDYERYIQNLREAFKKDVGAIQDNLPGIIKNHEAFFKERPNLAIALNTSCYIARELEKRTHPGDILATYPFEYMDSTRDVTAMGAIKTIQLFSASLRDTTTTAEGHYWVSVSKVRELVNSRRAFRIYFGLVYREAINRYDNVKYSTTNLVEILEKVAGSYNSGLTIYDTYKRYVLRLGDKVDALNKMIKEYDKTAPDSSGLERYAKYFRASVDLIEYCTEVSTLPIIDKLVPDIKPSVQKYFDIAYEVTDLVVDVYKKNYSSAINHVVKVYNLSIVKPLKESVAQTDSQIAAMSKEQKEAAKDSQKNLTASSDNSTTTLGKILKYGSFMATVATAKNSDEVAKAIETAALPIGSSKVKRTSIFNVSLNAYTGLFIGHESIRGVKDKGGFNTYGVTAPVGVALSKGHSILFINTGEKGWREGRAGWSTSLFLSLIDVGAVAAFRFKDDETAEVPTIQLKNIISPGAFLSLGIPRSPLSFNLGAQMGPNLRKINITSSPSSTDEGGNRTYWRFITSLCVDIPIFNFYTKSR